LDVSVYADPKFNDLQMREIRKGLKHQLDVSTYADPKFSGIQMWEMRERLDGEARRTTMLEFETLCSK